MQSCLLRAGESLQWPASTHCKDWQGKRLSLLPVWPLRWGDWHFLGKPASVLLYCFTVYPWVGALFWAAFPIPAVYQCYKLCIGPDSCCDLALHRNTEYALSDAGLYRTLSKVISKLHLVQLGPGAASRPEGILRRSRCRPYRKREVSYEDHRAAADELCWLTLSGKILQLFLGGIKTDCSNITDLCAHFTACHEFERMSQQVCACPLG